MKRLGRKRHDEMRALFGLISRVIEVKKSVASGLNKANATAIYTSPDNTIEIIMPTTAQAMEVLGLAIRHTSVAGSPTTKVTIDNVTGDYPLDRGKKAGYVRLRF